MPVTTEQIKAHRAGRKKAGMIGCIQPGLDLPLTSLRGISWRPEDPMNPQCFCFDCRSLWDPTGTIDLELITKGHTMACYTYESLLKSE